MSIGPEALPLLRDVWLRKCVAADLLGTGMNAVLCAFPGLRNDGSDTDMILPWVHRRLLRPPGPDIRRRRGAHLQAEGGRAQARPARHGCLPW